MKMSQGYGISLIFNDINDRVDTIVITFDKLF